MHFLLVRNVNLVREADCLGEGDASPLLHEEVQYLPDVVAVRPGAREQVRELEPHAGAALGRFDINKYGPVWVLYRVSHPIIHRDFLA